MFPKNVMFIINLCETSYSLDGFITNVLFFFMFFIIIIFFFLSRSEDESHELMRVVQKLVYFFSFLLYSKLFNSNFVCSIYSQYVIWFVRMFLVCIFGNWFLSMNALELTEIDLLKMNFIKYILATSLFSLSSSSMIVIKMFR